MYYGMYIFSTYNYYKINVVACICVLLTFCVNYNLNIVCILKPIMLSMIILILNNYRELKNRATGIDIFVPQYEHISGSFGGSVLYNVIVVTRLFYFKIPSKHKESDVVQFMVSFDVGIFFLFNS